LPLQYNNGEWIEDEKFEQTRSELFQRFGGLTYIMREFPLRGIWGQDNRVYQDFIITYTVIDFSPSEETTQFFVEYKEILKSRFEQKEILITVQDIGIF
jgi:hypothetical protein